MTMMTTELESKNKSTPHSPECDCYRCIPPSLESEYDCNDSYVFSDASEYVGSITEKDQILSSTSSYFTKVVADYRSCLPYPTLRALTHSGNIACLEMHNDSERFYVLQPAGEYYQNEKLINFRFD